MNRIIKILWIEEETSDALAERRAYIESSLYYEIEIFETYTEAVIALNSDKDYDVIIIDIRIPKGNVLEDELNIIEHEMLGFNSYGLELIKLASEKNKINKTMIYTNETWEDIEFEVGKYIKKNSFMQKKECRSNRMFENFIINIHQNSSRK